MDRLSGLSWNVKIPCAGCGAELTVEPDRRYVDCSYCHASNVVDLGGEATCFKLRGVVNDEAATGKMRGWLREHGLLKVEPTISSKVLVPFWSFKTTVGETSLLAADLATLPIPRESKKPAGQLEHFGPAEVESCGADIVEPTVPLPAALARAGIAVAGDSAKGVEKTLVYVPFIKMSYDYRGVTYQALVDEATGTVVADTWPSPRQGFDQRLSLLFAAALVSFIGLPLLLPGVILPILACLAASGALWWAIGRAIEGSEAKT